MQARDFQRHRARATVWLPKDEYAKVIGEFNTHLSDEQRKHRIIRKAIGDYVYVAENYGFNNYRIIGKVKME